MTVHRDVQVDERADPGPAIDIRRSVFVEEQGVSPAVEFDDGDDDARHFVASVADEPVGTARVRLTDEDAAKVERVAVLPSHRGAGVGEQVMAAAHRYARDRGRSRSIVHAQERVADFYASLGYERVGPVEDETDIPHVEMTRPL